MADLSHVDLITTDGVNHGKFIIEDCFEAVVCRCGDGYVHCPILISGGKCEECFEIHKERRKKYGKGK